LNLVLVNLLENASKYSQKGTKITITISAKSGFVNIAIKDNGVGIHEEDLGRIFHKFTRVNNELSDTVSGSGLGLYWADRIIKLHAGQLSVISKPNHGSTFKVSLPYEK
jgi:signal transduction histidine kinase